ncbi:hypothetical protein [Variovorax sp. PCZ-1]|uniref:hypothetical protein n=1 Tax=Variovorax sp. PCZ-1 TaxID=2835533 RepID=UPI001BCF2322|nr:hypothetical protein [Variovorax sp. PCZ-1]MBS7806821.1 hypothetical protein [Variovorax sp. PCZ-1]
MKLDQKQMHIVSQLFMAASKAGKTFDLGRFTKDTAYASDTMAQLAMHADQVRNEHLQGLVVIAMEQLASMNMPAPVLASPATPLPAPSPAPIVAAAQPTAQQYVGRLR